MITKLCVKRAVLVISMLFIGLGLDAQCTLTGWQKTTQTELSNIALKEDGSVWMWGSNAYGLKGDGSAVGTVQHPLQIGSDSDWVDIAAGQFFVLALKSNGDLYGWGDNSYGQLANGTYVVQYTPIKISEDVKSFSASYYHTMIVKKDGTLWGAGYNEWGNLGVGNNAGSYATWQQEATLATDWASVGTGYYASYGIKNDGTLWSVGSNVYGETGNGQTSGITNVFTQVGTDADWNMVTGGLYHAIGLKTTGKVFGWGYSGDGRLGIVGAGAQYFYTPQPIEASSTYSQVAASYDGSALLKTDGTLYVMGINNYGTMGAAVGSTYNLAPQQVGTSNDWKTLAARIGWFHYGLVQNDGTMWAWGADNYYQLGNADGLLLNQNAPTQVTCDDGQLAVTDVVANKNQISLYPNPANDVVYVKSPSKISEVAIYSMTGSLVKTAKIASDGAVSISSLPAGTYILKTQESSAGLKLIKK